MSISDEINRISGNVSDAFDAISDMGGTVNPGANSNDLASSILSIPRNAEGGGSGSIKLEYTFTEEDFELLMSGEELSIEFTADQRTEFETALTAFADGKNVYARIILGEIAVVDLPLNIAFEGEAFQSDTLITLDHDPVPIHILLDSDGGYIRQKEASFGEGGGVTSWNDLADRPFYSEYSDGFNIELPADKTGLPYVDVDISEMIPDTTTRYYKVPNVMIQANDLIGAECSFNFGDGDEVQTIESLISVDGGYYYDADLGIPPFYVVEDYTTMTDPTTFPDNGIYFLHSEVMGMVVSCKSVIGQGEEYIHKLDEKYLPEGGSDGKSAYELALENGFEGSEQEWLESLKGEVSIVNSNGLALTKLTDYLYRYNIYDDLNEADVRNFFENLDPNIIAGAFGCSTVRKGNFLGRTHDWMFSEHAQFIVDVKKTPNRHASVGVAMGFPALTKQLVESGQWSDFYKSMPFLTLDGINDAGVVCEINAAGNGVISDQPLVDITVEGANQIYMLQVVRFVLDNADSAQDGIMKLMNVGISDYMLGLHSQFHYMIADENNAFIVEFIDNEMKVITFVNGTAVLLELVDGEIQQTPLGAYDPIMTNFYNCEYWQSGIVNGKGLNRFNYLNNYYSSLGETKEDMADLMKNVFASKWSQTNESQTEPNIPDWTGFERGSGKSVTVHMSVYDLENKSLRVYPQCDTPYSDEYNLEYFDFTVDESNEVICVTKPTAQGNSGSAEKITVPIGMKYEQFGGAVMGILAMGDLPDEFTFSGLTSDFANGKNIEVFITLSDAPIKASIPMSVADNANGYFYGSTTIRASLIGDVTVYAISCQITNSGWVVEVTDLGANGGSGSSGGSGGDTFWVDGTVDLTTASVNVDKNFFEIIQALRDNKIVKLRLFTPDNTVLMAEPTMAMENSILFSLTIQVMRYAVNFSLMISYNGNGDNVYMLSAGEAQFDQYSGGLAL